MYRWSTRGSIEAPLEVVERALLDPAALTELAARAPMIAEATLIDRVERDHIVTRRARMRSAVTPPLFLRVVEGEHLEWIEEVTWDLALHAGTVSISPNLRPERRGLFRCQGRYSLAPRERSTERVVEIDIEVSLRIVGPLVERVIARQLPPQMNAELEVLRARSARLLR